MMNSNTANTPRKHKSVMIGGFDDKSKKLQKDIEENRRDELKDI